uniref:Uncharacterized protein n=1 Tax=Polytomella parva TaxID=51329 RepID=A0A7S0VRY9_9CHLO
MEEVEKGMEGKMQTYDRTELVSVMDSDYGCLLAKRIGIIAFIIKKNSGIKLINQRLVLPSIENICSIFFLKVLISSFEMDLLFLALIFLLGTHFDVVLA